MTYPGSLTSPPLALGSQGLSVLLLTSRKPAAFSSLGWVPWLSAELANASQTTSPKRECESQKMMDGGGGLGPTWFSPRLSTDGASFPAAQEAAVACGESLGPSLIPVIALNHSAALGRFQGPLSWGFPRGTWGWLCCSGRHRELGM